MSYYGGGAYPDLPEVEEARHWVQKAEGELNGYMNRIDSLLSGSPDLLDAVRDELGVVRDAFLAAETLLQAALDTPREG